jgi:hypothetical protein
MIRRKEEDMNCKRLIIATLVIFVLLNAIDYVVNTYLLASTYESPELKKLWRPDMMSKLWIGYVFSLLTSLLFTYIFVKGYEAKGLLEGVRFGILIWLFMVVPVSHGYYVVLDKLPYSLCLQWCGYGLIEMLVAGILVAAIYKPAPAKA